MEDKMERYAIVIPTNEEAVLLHCDDGDGLSLEDMQGIVEGYIETVPTLLHTSWGDKDCDRILLIVNEEGKLQGLPYNQFATEMSAVVVDDEIMGNAILMQARGDELVGFSESKARYIVREWCVEEGR